MADGAHQEKPISLFYSYSHRDEELRKKLEEQLAFLRRSEKIAEWHDRNIDVGDEWAKEIDRNLTSADVILLLVSASFIASEYCWSVEMKKALERHDKGEAKVIPVILRPCSWHTTPFGKLQAAPTDAKPVTSWSDPDEALYDVARKIERAVTDLQQQRSRAAEQRQQEAEETRKRVETEARQAAEEQQRKAQWRREQDKDRQAAEAKPEKQAERRAESEAKKPVEPRDLPDLAVFRDIDALWCPEMVVLPVGKFLMGSPPDEVGRYDNEGPQHWVTIGYRFAIGRYAVTFAEYDYFCEVTAREKPSDSGWGRGRRPVIHVGWKDGKAYAEWLTKETWKAYRLPSEAEWEYACRAGTTTRYWCGDMITKQDAKYGGWFGKTTEVGSYSPNPWGLYDTHGNVWEWVEDIYHDSYKGAPTDGTAWIDSERDNSSRNRVNRGGSWRINPRYLRSANRFRVDFRVDPDYRNFDLGFRVARTLA